MLRIYLISFYPEHINKLGKMYANNPINRKDINLDVNYKMLLEAFDTGTFLTIVKDRYFNLFFLFKGATRDLLLRIIGLLQKRVLVMTQP